jgi:SAM-dependent methyltransferase
MALDRTHRSGDHDGGRASDWGRTSADYAAHRPGPPDSYYDKLAELGVGLPEQRILDLGTGTGEIARRLASRGCFCAGTDIATPQIGTARRMARESGLDVDLRVASAESQPFADASFDAITANQCWIYFDGRRTLAECRRLLRPEGRLAVTFFSFLPRVSDIVALSEKIVLRFNPDWSGADWDGNVPDSIELSGLARTVGWFCYDEAVPFTKENWRGRMRAVRGIGASLSPQEVDAFDRAHTEALADLPGRFDIPHRIFGYVIGFGD